ncbi:amylovoran biosynthesis glycosyltransferase AmsE [Kushneria sinocarnis]|uniref:Amylovoran biosynthesis glycosyltransferase AmsE n=1 Tax=Kushneria sinocarnis TaxID=595502 RepID=A0A420WY26_9GAMM|nr:glycosyltransferase [Kushneria sinocarnis]RKR06050.1 amylovoran biosynthesis glycosyltransferase AmsE [Kushneria sinocarnis]
MSDFSVLISVYHKESPEFLRSCLSSLGEQTLPASEIVIVEDGPIGDELKGVINEFSDSLPIVSLPLKQNVGLGEALNQGMAVCSHDLVARMDADDLCTSDRFEKQISYLDKTSSNMALLGGAIAEFDSDPSSPHSYRILPTGPDQVRKFGKKRCPVNHMTVVFRKEAIKAVGGYKTFLGMEDYYLWARLLASGYEMDNLADVVVKARVGNGMIARRRGWHYFRQDLALQRKFQEIGFIGWHDVIINSLARAPFRLLPVKWLDWFYKNFLRKKAA